MSRKGLVGSAAASAQPGVTPNELQAAALAQLRHEVGTAGRGVVVMPCGSGKTLLGRWLAEQVGAHLTVVCVPTLALVPQTLLAYRSQAGSWPHAAMIACSDPATGHAVAIDDLELPDWARDAVTASNSRQAIGRFLTGPNPGARLIVSTYHSAPRVAAALQWQGTTADLLVCDEAHRLTGRPRSEFRAVLDDRVLPAQRRVFLTATPVEAAAWAADTDPDEVEAPLSLDDEHTFGTVVYKASFADAVDAGRLVDYDVHVLATRRGDELDNTPSASMPGNGEAVLTAAENGATRILTFHSRVATARKLAEQLDGHRLTGGRVVRAEHLEARHRAARRDAALGQLAEPAAGEVRVLASARVLTEGVDVPAVDTVVFAEPRSSAVDIVQAVGRAMRTAPGKVRGRIVLAATTGRSGLDEDTELTSSRWRHVWVTLRALMSMDPRFAAQLRARLTPGNEQPTGRNGPGLMVDLPEGLDVDRWMLRALDRTGGSWWHRYELLAAHTREHGHARPAVTTYRGGVNLGRWVTSQRTLHRQGALDDDRAAALEDLPGWAWNAREIAWWRAARLWARQHAGRSRPTGSDRWAVLAECSAWGADPPKHAYTSLAEFAVETCARQRRGELPRHLQQAAQQLPEWQWDLIPSDEARMVDALAEYAAWQRDLNAPHAYVHDGNLPLGAWLTAVRRRRYTGRLGAPLELELELLSRPSSGWTRLHWNTSDTAWRLGYLALAQYAAREGTCRIPQNHHERLPDYELNLSRWCTVQRHEHRYGRLDEDRVDALEQIAGWQWELSLRADHQPVLAEAKHGTRAGYAKGCKCESCTRANRDYEHTRANGRGTDLIDASPARGHLRILLGQGASQKALARAADLNVKTIAETADGTLARVRPETGQALLALTLETAAAAELPGRWDSLPAGPTWQLLDDMLARGWPKAWIAREIGQRGPSLQLNRDRVSRVNADAVADLHARLGSRCPPPRRRREPVPSLAEILASESSVAERRAG